MSFASVIDAVTRVVIIILLAVATVVVVLGLFRAYLGRRRFELVITDIVVPKELSASLIAELSEELRSMVHRRLMKPNPRESLMATVGKDIANHIAQIPGISESEVGVVQEKILQAPRHELLASPRDVLATVSGGIRALKPDRAEGLIQALSAILPAQRGLLVGSRVVCRSEADGCRMGLSIQVGPLSRGAKARATFWSQDLLAAEADLSFARPSWFSELLSLAAEWITVYLIGTLGVEGAAGRLRLRLVHRRYVKQRHALLDILTAQWVSYAMYDLQTDRPDVALEWAEQALEDAQKARDSLPAYYYPSYLVGSINDLCGNCNVGLSEKASDNEKYLSYLSQADDHFAQAAKAFAEAEHKLVKLTESKTFQRWGNERERRNRVTSMRIARLKDRLLAGDGGEGLTALDTTEITPFGLESTINAACLFAVAAWVADKNGCEASTYRLRACRYVVESVQQEPGVGFLRTDRDLNRGIASDDLDWLLDHAPKVDDQTKEERLKAIAATPLSPALGPPETTRNDERHQGVNQQARSGVPKNRRAGEVAGSVHRQRQTGRVAPHLRDNDGYGFDARTGGPRREQALREPGRVGQDDGDR